MQNKRDNDTRNHTTIRAGLSSGLSDEDVLPSFAEHEILDLEVSSPEDIADFYEGTRGDDL